MSDNRITDRALLALSGIKTLKALTICDCELLTPAAKTPIPPLSQEDLGRLSRYDRPLPEMIGYDQLLGGAR